MTTHQNYDTMVQTSLDNLLEGCQLIGFDWKYLYVNNAVVRQGKYKNKEDLLGYTMMEKYPGIENTEMFKTLEECMSARTSATMLNEFTFPDNSKGWFELRIEPVPQGIFILSMDVTERKRAELDKLEYVNSLEEMIFMTSHKVRQPVCFILGVMDTFDPSKTSETDLVKVTDYLRESVANLDALTKELTTFIHDKKIKIKA